MVGEARAVLVEQLLDLIGIEKPGVRRSRGAPSVAGEVIEATHEPVGKGHLKAKLAPAQRPLGEQRFNRTPQKIFTGSAAKLEAVRDGQRPIDKAVSEKR